MFSITRARCRLKAARRSTTADQSASLVPLELHPVVLGAAIEGSCIGQLSAHKALVVVARWINEMTDDLLGRPFAGSMWGGSLCIVDRSQMLIRVFNGRPQCGSRIIHSARKMETGQGMAIFVSVRPAAVICSNSSAAGSPPRCA